MAIMQKFLTNIQKFDIIIYRYKNRIFYKRLSVNICCTLQTGNRQKDRTRAVKPLSDKKSVRQRAKSSNFFDKQGEMADNIHRVKDVAQL